MQKIITLILLFFIAPLFSQQVKLESVTGEIISLSDMFNKQLKKYSVTEVKGSPFLYKENNTKGSVVFNGTTIPVSGLNYNTYSDEVGYKTGKDSIYVIDKRQVSSFKINNDCFVKKDDEFYQALFQGDKFSLYKKYKAIVIEGAFNPIDATRAPSRLQITDEYYIDSAGTLEKFTPSKKSLQQIFGDRASEIKSYIKKNHLSLKKDEDLIKIFEYYHQF